MARSENSSNHRDSFHNRHFTQGFCILPPAYVVVVRRRAPMRKVTRYPQRLRGREIVEVDLLALSLARSNEGKQANTGGTDARLRLSNL